MISPVNGQLFWAPWHYRRIADQCWADHRRRLVIYRRESTALLRLTVIRLLNIILLTSLKSVLAVKPYVRVSQLHALLLRAQVIFSAGHITHNSVQEGRKEIGRRRENARCFLSCLSLFFYNVGYDRERELLHYSAGDFGSFFRIAATTLST